MGWDVFGFFVENVVIEYGELLEVWIRRFIDVFLSFVVKFGFKKKLVVYVLMYIFNFKLFGYF